MYHNKRDQQEEKLKKNRETLDKYNSIEGVEELQKRGNLKEAAAIFSITGLQSFIDSFESVIKRSVQEGVDKAISEKISEVLEGATEGIHRFMQGAIQASVTSMLTATTQNPVELKLGASVDKPKAGRKPSANSRINSRVKSIALKRDTGSCKVISLAKDDMRGSLSVLMAIVSEFGDRPFKAKDINKVGKEKHNTTWVEPSKMLTYACKLGYFTRSGHGEYTCIKGENFQMGD